MATRVTPTRGPPPQGGSLLNPLSRMKKEFMRIAVLFVLSAFVIGACAEGLSNGKPAP